MVVIAYVLVFGGYRVFVGKSFNPNKYIMLTVAQMLHVNPFKKKIIMVPNEGTGKMVEKEESMSWVDAAKVAIVITITQIFAVFLTVYEWSSISMDPYTFLFNLFKFIGITFFGTFAALTGLARYFSNG